MKRLICPCPNPPLPLVLLAPLFPGSASRSIVVVLSLVFSPPLAPICSESRRSSRARPARRRAGEASEESSSSRSRSGLLSLPFPCVAWRPRLRASAAGDDQVWRGDATHSGAAGLLPPAFASNSRLVRLFSWNAPIPGIHRLSRRSHAASLGIKFGSRRLDSICRVGILFCSWDS